MAISWTIPTIDPAEDQISFARIYRDGLVINEVAVSTYVDSGLDLGTYVYCITFVYESGAETCPGTLCETVEVTGGGFVDGNVKEAAYLGGNNIEGAQVVLTNTSDNTIVFTFATDATGNYDGEVLAGTYNYEVTATGYITATLAGVNVPETATITQNFVMMEFPQPVELVGATEIDDNTVKVTWRSPGTILFEPSTETFDAGIPAEWSVVDGETAGGAVEGDEFERHFLGHGHHDLLELRLGTEAHEIDLASGSSGGEVGGLVKRVAGPGIEPRGQHHLVLQRRTGRPGDRFEGLQRIRDKRAADDDGEHVGGWWLKVIS